MTRFKDKKKQPAVVKDILRQLGHVRPSIHQQTLIESLLLNIEIVHPLYMEEQLTGRESSCLYWAAMGRSAKETAALLQIQIDTVKQYHKQIKRKLQCRTMAGAVFKGMRLGSIKFLSISPPFGGVATE